MSVFPLLDQVYRSQQTLAPARVARGLQDWLRDRVAADPKPIRHARCDFLRVRRRGRRIGVWWSRGAVRIAFPEL